MKRCILIFFLLLCAVGYSELILDINDTELGKGETAILSVVVKDQKLSTYQIEGLENFKILSQGESSSTRIVNGEKSSSKTYQYRILPLQEGTFTLKAIGEYKKDTYESNTLEIEVKENSTNNLNKNFFLKGELNKNRYYFGEKIILKEHLITTVNLDGIGFVENTKYIDFTEKNITEKGYEGKETRVEGKKAIDYTIYKAILEPLKSGNFTIPSRTLQVNTVDGSSFFSNTVPNYLQTEERNIEILELPQENKPDNFNGAVGTIKIDYKYNNDKNDKVDFGEAVNLNIKLRGNANIDTLEKIIDTDIQGIKLYQNVKETKEYVIDGEYIVEKDYEIVFIPQKSGEISIPEIEIPYFNTTTEKYEKLKIAKKIITVNPPKQMNNASNDIGIEKQEVLISQINTEEVTVKEKDKLYIGIIIVLVVTNVLSLITLLIFSQKGKNKTVENKDLKQLRNTIKQSKTIDELYNNFNQALKIKFAINIKSISNDQIIKSIGEDKGSKIAELIKEIETRRYFNKLLDKELIDKILEII